MRALVPLLGLLAGCLITETGNPELDASLVMRAVSSAPEAVGVGAGEATVVAQAWLSVERARLVTAASCDTPAEEEWELAEDVVTDTVAAADAFTARVPAGDYCRLRVRLQPAEAVGGAPAALLGHAVLVTGARADGVPFVLRSEEAPELDLRAAGGALTLDALRAEVGVALDVATWLADVDLDGATPGEDGTVRVDEENHPDLLEAFEEALEDALELDDDDGGDDD